MQLTQKLLGFLHRIFDKDPEQFLALRLHYDGDDFTWNVVDGVLTTSVVAGSGGPLTVNLGDYSIASLAAWLTTQPGYSIAYQDGTPLAQLSARVLIDGSGTQSQSNGDHLYGYQSILWAYLEAHAVELGDIRTQICEMLKQLVVTTASGEWLDDLGGFYNVERDAGEPDPDYANRIIAEVVRPRGNNVAIAQAVETAAGGLNVRVVDVDEILWQEGIYRDGTHFYNGTSAHSAPTYGLFDVEAGFDLETAELNTFVSRVIATVERFRDAGTHLRNVVARGSLSDSYAGKVRDFGFVVAATKNLIDRYGRNGAYCDGSADFDGSIDYDGGGLQRLYYNGLGRYNGVYLYDGYFEIYNDSMSTALALPGFVDVVGNLDGHDGSILRDGLSDYGGTIYSDGGSLTITRALSGGGTIVETETW